MASKDYGTYFNLSQNMFHHLYVCSAICILLLLSSNVSFSTKDDEQHTWIQGNRARYIRIPKVHKVG